MKTYKITVNGVSYDVTVEETEGASLPIQQTPQKTVAAAAPQGKRTASSGGFELKAPMPGTITNILISAGDSVKKGQTLLMLEAMKMENEISAPVDGTIAEIIVSKGSAVKTDDILLVIKEG